MKLEASYNLPADRATVWARLLDADALRSCIPGCQSLVASGADRWAATLSVGAGPIRGTYTGTVALVDQVAPGTLTLQVDGKGLPGFVKGSAVITLAEQGSGTRLSVDADGQVGGTVAAVGQRMLSGVARMLMDQFFACIGRIA